MGAGSDAMRDVEIVDDLALGDARGSAPAEAAETAGTRRRVATLRRTLRRWWPVPIALVLVLVAVQVAADARERDRLAAVRALPGVLREVDRDLTVRETSSVDPSGTWTAPFEVAGLRITVDAAGAGAGRTLYAASTVTGEQVWSISLDATTGRELWSTAREAPADENVLTDGRHLLALEPDPDRIVPVAAVPEEDRSVGDETTGSASDQVLVAYRLTDGSRAWTTPVPGAVVSVWEVDGTLVAYRADSSVVTFEPGS